MKIAIAGLPNVGKSTLFNALTRNHVLAANYPFATIEPNVGIVPVPDPRLDRLTELYNAKKTIPATTTFVDIAGLVRGASTGQGLGNKFLASIRECHTIVQVVRAFSDSNVSHVDTSPDAKRDIETINTELILADLQSVDSRLSKVAKDKSKQDVVRVLQNARTTLDHGETLSAAKFNDELIQDMQLLTIKPFIYVFNLDEADLSNQALKADLAGIVAPAQSVFLCAKTEAELSELDEADATELLQGLGQTESGLRQLIGAGYATLGLQTFLTAGEKEVRAWTIPVGATAPQAAGVIHTDFEKGFIRAEVVDFASLVSAGSLTAARAGGKARLEGRDYIMQPNDVVEFRFNV